MSPFGANTYAYLRSHDAAACMAPLAELGFCEFEVMVHPGHLWPADLSGAARGELRRLIGRNGWTLTSLNMPNIDINVAAAAPGMRAYSLALLEDTVRLAGDLGARGVVIGPGKANPLLPADAAELIGHFYAALDRLCPVAQASGTELWAENIPFTETRDYVKKVLANASVYAALLGGSDLASFKARLGGPIGPPPPNAPVPVPDLP